MPTSFPLILSHYRQISFSSRDKSDRFERLMKAYLKTDPKYAYLFKHVWLWNEFPGRKDLGGSDTGIDLVALTFDGDYWAIQCKCLLETSTIDKAAVDTFLSTSSRQFTNEEFKTVSKDLLTDYKVLILTLRDKDVPPAIQKMIADKGSEINADDASKLIGCINALSKQIIGEESIIENIDPDPMRLAVAFCARIVDSKKITSTFNTATNAYINSLPEEKKEQMVPIASKHFDGTMSAPLRNELLGWLKSDADNNECRVLTNIIVSKYEKYTNLRRYERFRNSY